jgi:hypothetical protein
MPGDGCFPCSCAGRRCCPRPPRPALPVGRDVPAHRRVAGLVGAEPARGQHGLGVVDDLDGRRQRVGIDPDEHLHPAPALGRRPPLDCEAASATESWADPSGATPHRRCPAGTQTDVEPHRSRRWAFARRASRRAPGPSLAGHRSYRKCQVAAREPGVTEVRCQEISGTPEVSCVICGATT